MLQMLLLLLFVIFLYADLAALCLDSLDSRH